MPLEKQSLNNFLPNGFETLNQEGYKENFSEDKIATGYEKDVPDIVSGPNLNNLIDVVGKNTNTLNNYVEYLNGMPINNVPTVNKNGQLDYIENNFLNENQITNYILEAPNGVASLSDNVLTVKRGLKFITPDSYINANFSNITSVINADINFTPAQNINGFHVFYLRSYDNGLNWEVAIRNYFSQYYKQHTQPQVSEALWFSGIRWRNIVNGEVKPCLALPFATAQITNGVISDFSLLTNNILTRQDLPTDLGFKVANKVLWNGQGLTSRIEFDLSDVIPKQPCLLYFSCTFATTAMNASSLVCGSNFAPLDVSVTSTNNQFSTSGNVAIPTNDAKVYFYNKVSLGGITGQVISLYGYQKIVTGG